MTSTGQKCKNVLDTATGYCNLNDKIDIYIKYSDPAVKSSTQQRNKPFFLVTERSVYITWLVTLCGIMEYTEVDCLQGCSLSSKGRWNEGRQC
jgi:hypothetical protein